MRALPALALALACCASPPPSIAPAPDPPAPPNSATAPATASATAPAPPSVSSASAARPAAAPRAPGSYQQLTDDEAQWLVVPHLGGRTLAQPAVRGPFGPSKDTVVAITTTADAPPAEFGGFVVLPDGRALPLPPLHDHWSGWEVHAVLFEDVDGDGAKELIVIAEYVTGIGPEGAAPFFHDSVIRWDGSAFVRLPAVEKRLGQSADAAAVRRALRGRAAR